MKLRVERIVRRGKYHTRVETSDGKQLVLSNDGGIPVVGQELDIEVSDVGSVELRPLRGGDGFPGLVDSILK